MKNLTMDELKRLTKVRSDCCISFYMPTHPAAASTDDQRIRYKNLLRRAEECARELAPKNKSLSESLAAAKRLMDNNHFWRYQSEGLTVFIAPDFFTYYRLPLQFDETFSVSGRFYIKPLLQLFMADGRFFILALSQGDIRLFSCTRHRVVQIGLKDVPTSMEESLQYDSKTSQLQFHTGTSESGAPGGNRPAMFHGHGGGIDDRKDEIFRFFLDVDQGLRPILAGERAPLVLAGVEYLLPLFRKATTYSHVLDDAVTGNPEQLKPEELHSKALKSVLPELWRQQRESIARYRDIIGKGYTAAGVRSVVPAAAHGKVDSLFVAIGEKMPGWYDPQANQVIVSDGPARGNEDLLDLAVVETIRHGGSVYALERQHMPEQDSAVAAVLRY